MKRLMTVTACILCLFMFSSMATASTVAFWQFDEKAPGQTAETTAGAIIDQTGNHNATSVGIDTQLYAEGAPDYNGGSALNFNPTNENALTVPNDSALQNFFADGTSGTIEAMIRTTSTDWQRLVTKQELGVSGYWYFRVNTDGRLRFETVDTTYPNAGFINRRLTGVAPVNDGEWHHIALVLDSDTTPGQTNMSFYIDYAYDNSSLGSTVGDIANIGDLTIGKRPDGVRFFDGDVDLIKFSDTALDPTEMVNYTEPEPTPFAKHVGLSDPLTEGFALEAHSGYATVAAVTDDLGVEAWKISGAGMARYKAPLDGETLDDMEAEGWTAKMTVRNLLSDDAVDWGVYMEASDRTDTYLLDIGSDASGNPTLYYLVMTSALTKEEISLTGISGDGYHTYEMVCDPENPRMVDVFVDDILQATINGADNTASQAWSRRFLFGSTDGGAQFDANYSLVELIIGPEEPPIPGDANGDGKVDNADAAALAANWQKSGGAKWSEGDFNGDGNVDDVDATILATNWQTSAAGSASVPEPGTIALILSAVAGMLIWRRRR